VFQTSFADIIGKRVTICGVGGYLKSGDKLVQTTFDGINTDCIFTFEQPDEFRGTNFIAIKNCAGLYLTAVPYGDDLRNSIANALMKITTITPSVIERIVGFVALKPTAQNNFEGAGYNYAALTAEPGPPSDLQLFEPTNVTRTMSECFRSGLRTRFGAYLRSQHWTHTVSQSPHCEGDETWRVLVSGQPRYQLSVMRN
jgi:hypothetical protein